MALLALSFDHKELAETVAISPNWCNGVYHRLGCFRLPSRHKQCKLGDIINECNRFETRNPCPDCKPPTAGRRFVHFTFQEPGVYHGDISCSKLCQASVFKLRGKIDFAISSSQIIHMDTFQAFCECWKSTAVTPKPEPMAGWVPHGLPEPA